MPTNDDVIFPDQRESGVQAKAEKTPADKKAGSEAFHTLLFAAVVCMIVSSLLAFAYVGLKTKSDANELAFKRQNVMSAFGYRVNKSAKAGQAELKGHYVGQLLRSEVDAAFAKHIVPAVIDAETGEVMDGVVDGDKAYKTAFKEKTALPLYMWCDDASQAAASEPQAYVFPVSGYGLWGTVYGYIGLEADVETIRSITFYKHQETAGLGGECEKEWFTKQFVGKKLRDLSGGIADFKVVKGKKEKELTEDPYAVGGISAATITGDGIQRFLVEDAKRFEPYFQKKLAATTAP